MANTSNGPQAASNGRNKRSHAKTKQNPSRGPPGILFTCEQGSERKCRRDALELLQRDWEAAIVKDNNSSSSNTEKVSLEEELKQLQNTDGDGAVFQQFDTRCKGVVIFLCKACPVLVEPLPRPKSEAEQEQGPPEKKPRVDETLSEVKSVSTTTQTVVAGEETTTTPSSAGPPHKPAWEPITAIQRIVHELKQENSTYPSSRWIARMIPCQATLYAGIPELEHTVQSMLQWKDQYPIEEKKTFAIRIKRRFCDVVRKDVIDAVAAVFLKERPQWKVNLKQPDFVVQLEFCQTLATVAICSEPWASVAYRQEGDSTEKESEE